MGAVSGGDKIAKVLGCAVECRASGNNGSGEVCQAATGSQHRKELQGSKIINKYAPSSENNTQAYIDALSKRLGVTGDQKLDLNDTTTLTGLIKGIARHEAGSDYLSDSDVMTGLSMAGVKGGGGQQAPSVSIGEVKVYTQATDANGIARDMRGAIIQQANTGVR